MGFQGAFWIQNTAINNTSYQYSNQFALKLQLAQEANSHLEQNFSYYCNKTLSSFLSAPPRVHWTYHQCVAVCVCVCVCVCKWWEGFGLMTQTGILNFIARQWTMLQQFLMYSHDVQDHHRPLLVWLWLLCWATIATDLKSSLQESSN